MMFGSDVCDGYGNMVAAMEEQRWWLGSDGKVQLRWSVGDGGGLPEMVVVVIGGGGWE
nr:hypothetical protein [Tanacetum cinerariifolium]